MFFFTQFTIIKLNNNYTKMKLLTQRLVYYASLSTQFKQNKLRNAVRFESQNFSWTHEELEIHSNAVAKGLKSLGFKKDDNILFKVPENRQTEIVTSQLGAAKVGVNIVFSKSNTQDQLSIELQRTKATGFVFQPTIKFENNNLVNSVYNLFPLLEQAKNGAQFTSVTYPSLRYLIQTGFYSYNGIYKFRNILSYAGNEYSTLEESSAQPIELPKSEQPLIVPDIFSQSALKAGLLNSVVNGRFVIYAQRKDIPRLLHGIPNSFVLATQEFGSIPESTTVVATKGSTAYQSHKRRLQI